MNEIKEFYDRVFGNRDGKFDIADLPNKAVLIAALVVDMVAIIAEARVYEVGMSLTGSPLLASGFVAVSIVPFYLGQVLFLYNVANGWQQAISVFLIIQGLFAGGYFGFADFVLQTNTTLAIANSVTLPLDINSLYIVAVVCTATLILSGLLFVFADDEVTNKRRMKRVEARAALANRELDIQKGILEKLRETREAENELKRQYGADYDALAEQLFGAKNPTQGGRSGKQ